MPVCWCGSRKICTRLWHTPAQGTAASWLGTACLGLMSSGLQGVKGLQRLEAMTLLPERSVNHSSPFSRRSHRAKMQWGEGALVLGPQNEHRPQVFCSPVLTSTWNHDCPVPELANEDQAICGCDVRRDKAQDVLFSFSFHEKHGCREQHNDHFHCQNLGGWFSVSSELLMTGLNLWIFSRWEQSIHYPEAAALWWACSSFISRKK